MKIIIAKTAGFCMGVRRAVDMVLDAANKTAGPICTYGPLIHNPQVLTLLENRGIPYIEGIPSAGEGTVLIRAHGVPKKAREDLAGVGFSVIDATCPRVIRVQRIIRKHAEKGYAVIIAGDEDHPEVIGLLGHADGAPGHVVNSLESLKALPPYEKAIIVAQTTQNTGFYQAVKSWAEAAYPNYKVFDTICDSTEKRQEEISRLAAEADAVVVVGGYESGNTQRLAEIAGASGKPTFHVETEKDLDIRALRGAETLLISAGASTPNWIIQQVCKYLESELNTARAGWRGWLYQVQRFLLFTNAYLALGGGALTYACTSLIGSGFRLQYAGISLLYLFSMHVLNHLTAIQSDRYNDPDRARFYQRHQYILALFSLGAGGLGLGIAATLGRWPLLWLGILSLLGLSYNISWIPLPVNRRGWLRPKDLPGSKTVLISLAWGVVTALLPAATGPGEIDVTRVIGAMVVFFWSTALVFARTAFFDILDMQGDRIVGKETLPILLGPRETLKWVRRSLVASVGLLCFAALMGWVRSTGWGIAVVSLSMIGLLHLYSRDALSPGMSLTFYVESHFLAAGMLAVLVKWGLA
ncbi:MAG: 4-hydroxy-3-methylbut-2-enyl diphosphate reductase [Deltaproteobacteria bacterium]|nr:MAG: 4-hydroxy-3-methylbut-2-enyl diphosphate reductase [Deltaproteobacteria bacterium]